MGVDCGSGTWQYTNATKPYYGPQLWGMRLSAGNTWPGNNSGEVFSTMSETEGDSGSALYFDNSGNSDWRVFAVASNGQPSQNAYSRFTANVYNFFVQNTLYPSDTHY